DRHCTSEFTGRSRLNERELLLEELERPFRVERRSEHEALNIFATDLTQFERVVFVRDAFGYLRQAKLVRHVYHRAQQHRALRAGVVDKTLVDLDRVEREARQIGK